MRKTLPLIVFVIFLIFGHPAYAIGISPSRIIVNFEPNLKQNLTFYIINNENKDMPVNIYVKGDLSDYIMLEKTQTFLNSYEPTQSFTCKLELPEKIDKPGTHDIRIGVVEASPPELEGGATVGAIAGVESQLWVMVPYPGYYAEVSLDVTDVAIGEPVKFTISVSNLGTKNFTAKGEIEIYDSWGNRLTTVDAGERHIKAGETGLLTVQWLAQDATAGKYTARAKVLYNGNTVVAEKEFKIGTLAINILDVPAVYIHSDQIAKFQIKVESLWNERIDNIYAELKIMQNGAVLGRAKSETFSLGAWEIKTLDVFLDSTGIEPGTYDIEIILYYAGTITTERFEDRLNVSAVQINVYILIMAAIVAAAIVMAAILLKKKKR